MPCLDTHSTAKGRRLSSAQAPVQSLPSALTVHIPQISFFLSNQPSKHALLMHMDRDRPQDVLTEARVPVLARGFDCPSDFAFAFPNIADLQPFIVAARDFWTANNIKDPESSVAAARLRKALAECHRLSLRLEPPEPAASSGSPCTQPNQIASWAEHLPPKLTSERVSSLVETFKSNYPGELLDADTTPSIRLLSLVHEGLKPGQSLKWVPWQYRLSSRQYQEPMEAKSARAVRSELQLLSQAFFDDTPEVSVEHRSLSAGWLTRIQTVFRNALALCQAAHLSNLKAFDKKIADLCLTQPDPNLGLRTVNTQELLSASYSCAQKCPSHPCQHRHTLQHQGKSDPSATLSQPACLHAPPRKARGSPREPRHRQSPRQSGALPKKGREVCRRYQTGSCTNDQCPFAHVCAIVGCQQKHPAMDHNKHT